VRRFAVGLFVAACCWAETSLSAQAAAWPPFLPERVAVPASIAASMTDAEALEVEQVWTQRTFERHVRAPRLDLPLPIYVAVIDSPDVLAAAAHHLGLTDESARVAADGSFELSSPGGSRARYKVLLSEPDRRVTLSRGTHAALGTHVGATVLGNLKLPASEGGAIEPELDVFVRVENPVLSWLAQALQWVLPSIADQELLRGFRLAQAVATWAFKDPSAFCAWIATQELPAERRRDVEQVVHCRGPQR
jgi:hypothetical protein